MKHIIESQQFDRETLQELFKIADSFANGSIKNSERLRGKIMASLFYEPSTRTRFSFESAMFRLGGSVISTENAMEFSSAAKGETLEDSIRVMNDYADVIILRHPEAGATERAGKVSNAPVINAGDGAGQHPTQALLDLYTIKKEIGKIDGIHIALTGDLKHGRTVRSLTYLLGKYDNIKISFVSPESLEIGDDILSYCDKHNIAYEELEKWDDVIDKVDVMYNTRVQKERFDDPNEYEKVKGVFVFDRNDEAKMKDGSVIMHPLSRVGEITTEVDDSPKAAYFRQAGYGVLVRMALLQMVLS